MTGKDCMIELGKETLNIKKLIGSKKEIFLFLAISILALGIRLLRVVNYQQPVFGDEAIYIRWSQVMRAEPTLRFLPLSDGKQPLFMWVTIPFQKLISDPLIAGRLVSVACGTLTLFGIYILSLIIFHSRRVGFISTLIYALSPFAVFFDTMALSDSMLSMFGIWTLVFGLLTVKYKRLDFSMLAGFSLGAALLTKSPAVLFALLLPSVLIFSELKRKDDWKMNLQKLSSLLILMIPTYLIGFGIYNILRLGPNFQMIALRNKDYIYPIRHIIEDPKNPFVFHVKEIVNWLWLIGPSVLVILIPFAIILRFTKYKKEILLLCAWSLIPLSLNSMFAKVFTARYIFYTLPFLYILSSTTFINEIRARLFILLITLFILHSLVINWLLIFDIQKVPLPTEERSGYLEGWTAGYGILEASNYIRDYHIKNPSQKIVVGTEGYFGTLPDGLQMYLNDLPEITVIGVGIDLKEIPDSLIQSKRAGNKTFFVINDSRLLVDPEKLGLNIIAIYPKALRKPGTKEFNTLGPQDVLYLFQL